MHPRVEIFIALLQSAVLGVGNYTRVSQSQGTVHPGLTLWRPLRGLYAPKGAGVIRLLLPLARQTTNLQSLFVWSKCTN